MHMYNFYPKLFTHINYYMLRNSRYEIYDIGHIEAKLTNLPNLFVWCARHLSIHLLKRIKYIGGFAVAHWVVPWGRGAAKPVKRTFATEKPQTYVRESDSTLRYSWWYRSPVNHPQWFHSEQRPALSKPNNFKSVMHPPWSIATCTEWPEVWIYLRASYVIKLLKLLTFYICSVEDDCILFKRQHQLVRVTK